MKPAHHTLSTTIALCGTLIAPTAGALDPATFDEYVGIGLWDATGANSSLAEFVNLTVQSSDFDHRGGGTGFARAGDVVPVTYTPTAAAATNASRSPTTSHRRAVMTDDQTIQWLLCQLQRSLDRIMYRPGT